MKKLLFILIIITTSVPAVELPRTLFVENSLGRTLSTVDLETGIVNNDVLTLGQVPNQVLALHDKVFVLNSVPAEVMIIDAISLQVLKRIALPEGSNPYAMALVGSNRLYVTLLMANSVAVVDLEKNQVSKLIACGTAPQGIITDGNTALVANTGGYPSYQESSVAFIDIAADSVTQRLPVPANPQVVRKGPDWNYYVLCSGIWGNNAGKIAVINPIAPPDYSRPALVDTIAIGGYPSDLAVLPNGMAYACDWGDRTGGFLYKVNIYTTELLHGPANPLRVGRGAIRMFWDKKKAELYICAFDQDVLQKFDIKQDKVSSTYPVGDGCQDATVVERIADTDPWADEVVSFSPGQNWSRSGYDFFPDNILGPPDPDQAVGATFSSSDPNEVLSLGHGGEITLVFTDNVVIDNPGPDFLIFENVFINSWTRQPFIEAATVAVSQDGVNFVEFPWDTVTCNGLAGAHVIKSTVNPTDPESSGADQFDLQDVGLSWIRYVRITDMGDRWHEGLYNRDFDLDAVVAVHSRTSVMTMQNTKQADLFCLLANYPNPFNPSTTVQYELPEASHVRIEVMNVLGQRIAVLRDQSVPAGYHTVRWDGRTVSGERAGSGVYFCRMQAGAFVKTIKMMLLP